MSWEKLNQVTGQSSYVDDLVQAVESFSGTIKPLIEQKKYLRNFFDKACRLVSSFRVGKDTHLNVLKPCPDEVYERIGEEPTFERNWWRASMLEVALLSVA